MISSLRAVVLALCAVAASDVLSRPNEFCVFVPSVDEVEVSVWREGVRTRLKPRSERVAGGTFLTLDTACDAGRVLVVETAAEIGILTLDGRCGGALSVSLEKSAEVIARFSPPAGATLPHWGASRLTCRRATVDIPFAIAESGVRTSVPVSCVDLSFYVPTYSPATPPSLKWRAGETHDLGTIALRRGAAATLRVLTADREPVPEVRVSAVRTHDLIGVPRTVSMQPFAEAITDSSGRARLDGLPSEQLVFLIRAPGRVHPRMTDPYRLMPGDEKVIDDFLLDAPGSLSVTVSLTPRLAGLVELKGVELHSTREKDFPLRTTMRGTVTGNDAKVEDVPPGQWRVTADLRLKNGFVTSAGETTVEIESGVEHQVTLTVEDAVYSGRVTRAGLPVRAVLNLYPAERTGSRRPVVARSAPDGTFQVLLEGPGRYRATVQDSDDRHMTYLGEHVVFGEPQNEVAIVLPTGRIIGRVVKGDGSPVSNVEVSAEGRDDVAAGRVAAVTKGDGLFVISDVSPGTWSVVASSKDGTTEPLQVTVGTSDVDGATLLFEETRSVTVRVIDATGALVPQSVLSVDFMDQDVLHVLPPLRPAPAGTVQLKVTATQQSSPANLVVRTWDGRRSCTSLRLDRDTSVRAASDVGDVRVVGPNFSSIATRTWLHSSTGCVVRFLGASDERNGETAWVMQKLAVGAWSLVEIRSSAELAALITGRGAPPAPLARFNVEPGRTTTVVLP